MHRSGSNKRVGILCILMLLISGLKAQEALTVVRLEKLNAQEYRVHYQLDKNADLGRGTVVLKIFRKRGTAVQEVFSRTITPSSLRAGSRYTYNWKPATGLVRTGDQLQAKIILSYAPNTIVKKEPSSSPNIPPKANAGSFLDLSLPLNQIQLDGSRSYDSNGTIRSYRWKQIAGPTTLILRHADSAITTITGDIREGKYAFELNVSDNQGATATDRVVVTIRPALAVEPQIIVESPVPERKDTVQAVIPVQKSVPSLKGGPANALINLLVPGLGHYYVSGDQYGKGRKSRSFLITAAYAGSIGGAFYFRNKFGKQYATYKALADYREYQYDDNGNVIGVRGADGTKTAENLNAAKSSRRNALILLGVGGSILATDLVFTYLKGARNKNAWKKDNSTVKTRVFLSSEGYGMSAGIRLTF